MNALIKVALAFFCTENRSSDIAREVRKV